MKNRKIALLVIIIAAAAVLLARLLQHTPIAAKDYSNELYVRHVIDGDTIELSNGEMVRYIGIDTPELRERHESRWVYSPMPYAEEAKDFNKKLIEGKQVRLEFDVDKRDRYNRLLAYVYPVRKDNFSNGVYAGETMVNIEMVREGYAMIYTYPPNVKYTDTFLKAQKEARENERGLWKGLKDSIISSSETGKYIGQVKTVETEVYNTFLSDKLLILNCRDNFKVVMFRNNLSRLPNEVLRSPDTYFRHKAIRLYGIIEEYKGFPEIVLHDLSQLEIME